jgi:hypothetical protein
MNTRVGSVLVASLGLLLSAVPRGEEPRARSVAVLSADASDPRIAATRRAVRFWNETLAAMRLTPRFAEPVLLVVPETLEAVETYARLISLDQRRLFAGAAGPPAPSALTDLPGDVLVLLSTQRIVSFAWPLAGAGGEGVHRYFLAIRTDRVPPLANPGVTHNVIAHELGHTLGLTHNGTPTMLMCGACETEFDPTVFLPLTPLDRSRLLELHSAP